MPVQVKSFKPPVGRGPYKVTLSDGKEYASFDSAVYSGLAVGMWIEAGTSMKPSEKNGRVFDNFYLDSWQPAEPPTGASTAGTTPPVPPKPSDTIPAEVWEAKDRSIAMESALASAAQFMQAVAVANPEQVKTANWIASAREAYKLVQKARLNSFGEE